MKAAFAAPGTSGFTASLNSFGVTAYEPFVPFGVSNPARYATSWQVAGGNTSNVKVIRYSDSASTVFDTPCPPEEEGLYSEPLGPICTKFLSTNGLYLRSDFRYLHSAYGSLTVPGSSGKLPALFLILSPLKILPSELKVQGIRFASYYYTGSAGGGPGPRASYHPAETLNVSLETLSRVLDLEVLEEINFSLPAQTHGSVVLDSDYRVVLASSSLTFTL